MRALASAAALSLLCACPSGLDLERGRHYACERSEDVAAQCPAGWVCTLDGFCQDEALPGAFRCESSSDCTGGWHCGPAGVCYDRADAGEVACRQDVAEDCAPGWRCAFDGVCRNLAEQGLRAAPADAQLQLTIESPRYELEAHGVAISGEVLECAQPSSSWALAVDGGVRHVVSRQSGYEVFSNFHPLPDVTSIAALGRDVIAITSTQAAYRLTTEPDGGTRQQTLTRSLDAGGVSLRAIRDARGWVLGLSGAMLGLVAADGGELLDADRMPGNVTDFTAITERDGVRGGARGDNSQLSAVGFIAVTGNGVYFAPQALDGWPQADAGPGTPFEWISLALGGVKSNACDVQLGLEPVMVDARSTVVPPGETAPWSVVVAGIDKKAGRWKVAVSSFTDGRIEECASLTLLLNAEACQSEDEVPTLVRVSPANLGEVLTRCRAPDGTERTYAIFDSGSIIPTSLVSELPASSGGLGSGPTLPASSATHLFSFYEQSGRFATCVREDRGDFSCHRPVLGEPPRYLTSLEDGGTALLARRSGSVQDVVTHLASPAGYTPRVNMGVNALSPCGAVDGLPESYLRCEGSGVKVFRLGEDEPLAELVGSTALFPDSAFEADLPAAALRSRDGGTSLIVGAYDAIWAGELPTAPDAGPGRLQPRLSPAPRGRITSMAVTPVPAGDGYATGFLIAQERVFALSAASETQWRADEVSLPAGRPLAVWLDGARGRAAYADGRVFAVPSGVQLAPALPGLQGVAAACGHGYALAPEGVFVLDLAPDGALPGRWRPVPLPPLPEAARVWTGGKLLADRDGLLAVTRYGVTVRLRDATCP